MKSTDLFHVQLDQEDRDALAALTVAQVETLKKLFQGECQRVTAEVIDADPAVVDVQKVLALQGKARATNAFCANVITIVETHRRAYITGRAIPDAEPEPSTLDTLLSANDLG